MKIPDFETLEEAKQFLRDNWTEGVPCPCCTQFVKQYKRTLQSTMAVMLISLYKLERETGEEYHHVTEMMRGYSISGSGDFASSRFWGLTEEQKNNDNPDTNKSGYWKLTPLGKEFVKGKTEVFSHIKVFNAKHYGFDGKMITIRDALGKKFSYEELMYGTL